MLDQTTADNLMAVEKQLVSMAKLDFPRMGTSLEIEATDIGMRERFRFDVQRKGKIKASKCTYLEMYYTNDLLVRLDIDGPPHENPDGQEVPCPHIHIYREGDEMKWAFQIELSDFTDTANLGRTLGEFLKYCKVQTIPSIQYSM